MNPHPTPEDKAALADRLRAARQKLQLTQLAMAQRIGVSLDTYRPWEQGSRYPRELFLRAIDKALKEAEKDRQ